MGFFAENENIWSKIMQMLHNSKHILSFTRAYKS